MKNLDIFGDNRKIPSVSVNVKIKVDTHFEDEEKNWNKVFGYIMKKPRTKLEFLIVNKIRLLSLVNITLDKIKPYITDIDYQQLKKVENIFNNDLTSDVKSFILAILKVSPDVIKQLQ